MSNQPISIDDADDNDIQYLTAGLWNHQDAKPNYQEGTFSEGLTNAQAEFRFNGTGVMVYGVASPRPSGQQGALPPSVSFSIDGGIPIPVVSDPDLQETEYSHQFYDSHTLSSGEHVLHMNVTHAEDDWPFVLDYILYVPLAPLPRPSSSSDAPSAQASFVKTSHTPAIVGGVVGGMVLLLAAVLYAYFGKTSLRYKHDLSTNAVRNAGSKKVDLLDDDCKFPPPSPLTPKSDTDADVESMSAYTFTEMRFRSRATSLSLNSEQHHTLVARGNRRSMSDLDCESAISPSHSPPSTPSASTFSHGAGAATRSSTTFQSVLTPPSAAYRASHGPHITYRPATPSEGSFSQSFQAGPDTGPNGSSTVARQSEKVQLLREQRQATFHADSGVRFKAGQTLPVDVQSPSANPRPPPPAPPLSEASTSTSAGLAQWKQQQQRKKRVSFGGSAISEVPPMYTPN
ncbi:hypothetical protein L226DRAFT_118885 [Lentinus tigrinus ALCF2SS1-7]|uniref:Uncharacterized protein n=1 Tax=Lentinus tigrinus ALCF2SS1-6 TaxID=1328759 RepID=A0A5C2STL1_9APHY|nr:hypothetical protein L227DRAFT_605241 [Lentinus tigrinus ALCF2SS1-6]RPD80738.1 hypothetical protein L226DRAFT_118885 [Lentinus tigrinus ALCF2SS1-7]